MINLLPPEEKRELAAEEVKKIAMILGLIFFFSLLCLSIILVSLKAYLVIQIGAQKSSLELIKQQEQKTESQTIQEAIKDSNKKLVRISDFDKNRISLVQSIEKLIKTIPEGAYLTDISYSKTSSQIILAGSCPSLDVLDQFKSNLENEEAFKEINFPLSSLIDPTKFSGVTITINNESL